MKLTIIGCTGSMSGPQSPASCYLVQAKERGVNGGSGRTWSVAFDMGPGSFGALMGIIDPRKLDAVVFSHGHADHMGDVISLHVHHRWHPQGQVRQLPVYGPEGIAQRTAQIDGWATEDEFAEVLDFRTLSDRSTFQVGPMKIQAFAGNHTVPSFGYRITGPGEKGCPVTIAYTGDTDSCDSITEMASGADLLLSEAAFTCADTVRNIHLDGKRAGQLAADAQVGKLVLTHIQPWTDPQIVLAEVTSTWSGETEIAVSGQKHSL